jgi:hypothetical protein
MQRRGGDDNPTVPPPPAGRLIPHTGSSSPAPGTLPGQPAIKLQPYKASPPPQLQHHQSLSHTLSLTSLHWCSTVLAPSLTPAHHGGSAPQRDSHAPGINSHGMLWTVIFPPCFEYSPHVFYYFNSWCRDFSIILESELARIVFSWLCCDVDGACRVALWRPAGRFRSLIPAAGLMSWSQQCVPGAG